jgi:uncharacterized protein (TIGR02118 family)
MIKFVVVLYKKPETTREEFRNHLFHVHAPLARKIPGLRKCIYNSVVPDATPSAPDWGCVVELYFDDFDSMQASWASPEGQEASKDNANFADMAKTSWSVVEQVAVL